MSFSCLYPHITHTLYYNIIASGHHQMSTSDSLFTRIVIIVDNNVIYIYIYFVSWQWHRLIKIMIIIIIITIILISWHCTMSSFNFSFHWLLLFLFFFFNEHSSLWYTAHCDEKVTQSVEVQAHLYWKLSITVKSTGKFCVLFTQKENTSQKTEKQSEYNVM